MTTTQIIEALLFASDAPLAAADLARAAEAMDEEAVEAAIAELRAQYEQTGRAFQVYEIGGGFQILTRPDFAPYLERFDTVPQTSRLSSPALEVLAVIAYRQPIDRTEIEEIRGVGSSGVLRTLQDRGLVEVVGRGEGLGRPLLYGTTRRFLEHFGFRALEDLPRPDELPVVLREKIKTAEQQGGAGAGTDTEQQAGLGAGAGTATETADDIEAADNADNADNADAADAADAADTAEPAEPADTRAPADDDVVPAPAPAFRSPSELDDDSDNDETDGR